MVAIKTDEKKGDSNEDDNISLVHTIHALGTGLDFLNQGKRWFGGFWIIVFTVVGLILVAHNIPMMCMMFMERQVTTKIRLNSDGFFPFPAVTICNQNPLQRSVAMQHAGRAMSLDTAFKSSVKDKFATERKHISAKREIANGVALPFVEQDDEEQLDRIDLREDMNKMRRKRSGETPQLQNCYEYYINEGLSFVGEDYALDIIPIVKAEAVPADFMDVSTCEELCADYRYFGLKRYEHPWHPRICICGHFIEGHHITLTCDGFGSSHIPCSSNATLEDCNYITNCPNTCASTDGTPVQCCGVSAYDTIAIYDRTPSLPIDFGPLDATLFMFSSDNAEFVDYYTVMETDALGNPTGVFLLDVLVRQNFYINAFGTGANSFAECFEYCYNYTYMAESKHQKLCMCGNARSITEPIPTSLLSTEATYNASTISTCPFQDVDFMNCDVVAVYLRTPTTGYCDLRTIYAGLAPFSWHREAKVGEAYSVVPIGETWEIHCPVGYWLSMEGVVYYNTTMYTQTCAGTNLPTAITGTTTTSGPMAMIKNRRRRQIDDVYDVSCIPEFSTTSTTSTTTTPTSTTTPTTTTTTSTTTTTTPTTTTTIPTTTTTTPTTTTTTTSATTTTMPVATTTTTPAAATVPPTTTTVTPVAPRMCLREPCRYTGACTDLPDGGYFCTCYPGYSGTNCEINIERCQGGNCYCTEPDCQPNLSLVGYTKRWTDELSEVDENGEPPNPVSTNANAKDALLYELGLPTMGFFPADEMKARSKRSLGHFKELADLLDGLDTTDEIVNNIVEADTSLPSHLNSSQYKNTIPRGEFAEFVQPFYLDRCKYQHEKDCDSGNLCYEK